MPAKQLQPLDLPYQEQAASQLQLVSPEWRATVSFFPLWGRGGLGQPVLRFPFLD